MCGTDMKIATKISQTVQQNITMVQNISVLYKTHNAGNTYNKHCAVCTVQLEIIYRVAQKKRYPCFNSAITSVNVHRFSQFCHC